MWYKDDSCNSVKVSRYSKSFDIPGTNLFVLPASVTTLENLSISLRIFFKFE